MFLTVITFLIVLSVLVMVHEFGHFLLAKKAGIRVEEFGVGYPPRALAKKIGETVYSLNWIPFGGFVRLFGEELSEVDKTDSGKTFWAKSKKARTAVILGGVLANFILGIICFSVVYSVYGIPVKTNQVKIVEITKDSPAEKMGLKTDDIILALNDKSLNELDDFISLIREKKGQEIRLLIQRTANNPCQEKVLGGGPTSSGDTGRPSFSCQDGNIIFFITPRAETPEGEGPLGVVVSNMEIKKFPFWQMPFRGAIEGTKEALNWGIVIFLSLKKMLSDLIFQGVVPKDVAGPIGIFQATGVVAKSGILSIFQFVGILSVNLAVLNIMPLPALDGGRIIFVVYELITKKRPRPSIEHWINSVGMALLILLLIIITVNDIQRILTTTSLISRIRSWLSF